MLNTGRAVTQSFYNQYEAALLMYTLTKRVSNNSIMNTR